MIMTTLATDKASVAILDDKSSITLKLHQQIDFKLPNVNLLASGKIERFIIADAVNNDPKSKFFNPSGVDSVWAYIINVADGEKHWISLKNWKSYYNDGIFKTTFENNVTSNQPTEEDVPF